MARKKITPAPQTDVVPQAGSVQQTAADIPVQDLKDRFQARSIPLETDFWNLIDVADCGRKAAGLSPDVDTPATDTGLMLDSTTGQLKVKPETDKGISVTDKGVGVVANPNGGIIVESAGVGISYDATLDVNNNSLGVSDAAFDRKYSYVVVETTSQVRKLLMFGHANAAYYAKVVVSCNNKQHFIINAVGNNLAAGYNACVSLSNVCWPGSSASINNITVGYGSGALMLALEVVSNAGIEISYSLSDLQNMTIYPNLDGDAPINFVNATIPVNVSGEYVF